MKKFKTMDVPKVGMEHGRPDIERIGLFAELGYLVGKKYTPVLKMSEIRDPKKRQMFPGGSKVKTGLQDCYFDREFKRVFIGEGYPRAKKGGEGKKKKKKGVPGIIKPFIPSKVPNPLYYRGEAYGYFSDFGGLSPRLKKKPKKVKEPRGIYTCTPKFGGPGYGDMCLNPYPIHLPDKYDIKIKKPGKDKAVKKIVPLYLGQYPNYFDLNPYFEDVPQPPYKKMKEIYLGKIGPIFTYSSPAKWDGGCKEGTFEKFPEYTEDRYNDPAKIEKVLEKIKAGKKAKKKEKKKGGPNFIPPACCKTLYTTSVLTKKVDINVNIDNWTEIEPLTYTKKFEII